MRRIAVGMVTLLLGCHLACQGRRNPGPTSVPAMAAVVGVYQLAGDARTLSQYGGSGDLDLRADGSFAMRNMPGWWEPGELLSVGSRWAATGHWRVARVPALGPSEPTYLVLEFVEINATPAKVSDFTPFLYGTSPPYEIRIPIGDPDNGHYLILQKQGGG